METKYSKRSRFLRRSIILLTIIMAVQPMAGSRTRKDDLAPVRNYYKMLDSLKTGWNTWDTRSMFTQLYLPEAFSVKLALVDADGNVADDLRAGNARKDAAYVHPYDHMVDNSYSEVDATWHGVSVKLRSSSEGDRLVMLVTPTSGKKEANGLIRIKPEYAWPNANSITGRDRLSLDGISSFHFETNDKHVAMDGGIIGEGITFKDGCYYCKAGEPILIYTGDPLSVEEAESLLAEKKRIFEEVVCASYGQNKELYRAIHSILSWDPSSIRETTSSSHLSAGTGTCAGAWSRTMADMSFSTGTRISLRSCFPRSAGNWHTAT